MDELDKVKFIRYALIERELAEIFEIFLNEGLHPILIKGWSAAQYYPKPFERHIGDYDLAFSRSDYDKALELQKSRRLNKVDVHLQLRNLDSVSWEIITVNSILKPCGNTRVRVLCPEDHLRVLCVHWLTDGGVSREKLLDIYYLLKDCGETLDWGRVFDQVSEKRREWVQAVVSVVMREIGGDVGNVPSYIRFEDLPEWFVGTLRREWKYEERLVPLHFNLKSPTMFLRQLQKRFPPNPIQSMVEMEGKLFGNRVFYQAGCFFKRIGPSLKRIFQNGSQK